MFLIHYPWDDPIDVRHDIVHKDTGSHIFFRRTKTLIQARFTELYDQRRVPKAFLLGSPHVDNYALTNTGYGMIDFDRSHIGPYVWDLVCIALSLNLRCETHWSYDYLFEYYRQGLANLQNEYPVYTPLTEKPIKKWMKSTEAYLEANKKWAKKMRCQPIPKKDPLINELVKQYFEHLNKPKQKFSIIEAGRAQGTFGRIHNLIAVEFDNEIKLLDIKHTKTYHNEAWGYEPLYFYKPCHQGVRMIEASNNHAPGVTEGESYATVNGIEHWARIVPTVNLKIKNMLQTDNANHLAQCVAMQIGLAHAKSVDSIADISEHIKVAQDNLIAIINQLTDELKHAYHYYTELAACED